MRRLRLPARDSLRARLLASLLAALAILFAGTSYYAYREALAAANIAYDRSLLAAARAIAERVDIRDGRVTVDVPYVALDFFEADVRGRVFYRVSGIDGEFVSGFDDLPQLPRDLPRSEEYFALARFYDAAYRGSPVRVAALYQPVVDERHRGMALVQVAETLDSREHITGRLLRGTLMRQLLVVLLIATVIVLVVRAALRPVERLGRELSAREPSDLSPLDADAVPAEVRPIVRGMNDYMQRLRAMLEAQDRFIADASHQLRTPLTLIKTQAQVAMRESDPERLRESVAAIHRSVSDAGALAEQMLRHARARHGIAHADFAAVDLSEVARHVALEAAPAAVARGIALEFEAGEHVVARGDATLLQEMLRNLLDNAIRHGPRAGRVVVRVGGGEAPWVEVEDSGAGIPRASRAKMFEPFTRGEAVSEAGAGLGLAIARDVAQAHGATLEMCDAQPGHGFRVRVRFHP